MTDAPALKPCPFCGGDAEADSQRAYRALGSGRLGKSSAVYCTACEADISICMADVPNWTVEDAAQYVSVRWNTRTYDAEPDELIGALSALIGRVMNAQIDMSTGKTKAQVDAALTEALRAARATLAKVKEG